MPDRPSDPASAVDEGLIARCLEGDSSAWRDLVDRYRRLVFRVPLSLGLQASDAEEVFQETFIELLRALPEIRDASRIDAWLVTTARRASIRLRRAERRRAEPVDDNELERLVSPPQAEIERELDAVSEVERVRRALDSLNEPCRTLLSGLFSDPPRSYRDMAAELHLAVGTLGATRWRCLQRLRLHMRRSRPAARKT